jgi:hypothetical protein
LSDHEETVGGKRGPVRKGVSDPAIEGPTGEVYGGNVGIVELHEFNRLRFDIGIKMDLVDDNASRTRS